MRINRSTSLMLSAVVALAVAAPAAAQRDEGQSPQDIKDQSKEETTFATCEDSDGGEHIIKANVDDVMWPPNHKYQDFQVTAVGDDGDENVTLNTNVTHDEYVPPFDDTSEGNPDEEEVGAGNTVDDARPFNDSDMGTGEASTEHEVRSERSGRGDGRTYRVTADAMFDNDSCSGTFEILVPHDMRSHKAPAKEDKTGSTGPNQG